MGQWEGSRQPYFKFTCFLFRSPGTAVWLKLFTNFRAAVGESGNLKKMFNRDWRSLNYHSHLNVSTTGPSRPHSQCVVDLQETIQNNCVLACYLCRYRGLWSALRYPTYLLIRTGPLRARVHKGVCRMPFLTNWCCTCLKQLVRLVSRKIITTLISDCCHLIISKCAVSDEFISGINSAIVSRKYGKGLRNKVRPILNRACWYSEPASDEARVCWCDT